VTVLRSHRQRAHRAEVDRTAAGRALVARRGQRHGGTSGDGGVVELVGGDGQQTPRHLEQQVADAKVAWHLYLMAQPVGVPEPMIEAVADTFFASFLDGWVADPDAIGAEHRAEYLRASRAAVPSIVADYRASAGIDVVHDRADRDAGRTLAMPVTVVQQDWGAALGYDAAALWGAWADDLEHRTTRSGHFMAEEAPAEVVADLRALLAR